MGCINTNTAIKVKSIKSFKKEIEKNMKQNESEVLSKKVYSFSDFTIEDSDSLNSVNRQSRILIEAEIKNNELIFL